MNTNPVKDALLGVAVADAIGVPVEFQSRQELAQNPVLDIRGYGTYQQPPGTWSDDSSLTFCLAESLSHTYDLADMAEKFIQWKKGQLWTPHGKVFDIGLTTRTSIDQLELILRKGNPADLTYLRYSNADEYTNGNGSLMRIMPLLFHLEGKGMEEQFECIWEVSALTHGHIRAALASAIYLRLAEYLRHGHSPLAAYQAMQKDINQYWDRRGVIAKERQLFHRILQGNIQDANIDTIQSDGYVLHSLEAALWCLLREETYEATILSAVNLGSDTDTTAAIVGGLAGLYYGADSIPGHWLRALARLEDIENLCNQLQRQYKAMPPPIIN